MLPAPTSPATSSTVRQGPRLRISSVLQAVHGLGRPNLGISGHTLTGVRVMSRTSAARVWMGPAGAGVRVVA